MTPSEIQDRMSALGYPDDPQSARIDKLRQIFASFPGCQRVLDVGCANGTLLKPLLSQHEIHGVDLSETLVKIAVSNGVKALRHDLDKQPLPYADKSFDSILFGETIEHQVDTDWVVSEVNRVLKPGGKLVLTFPNIRTFTSLVMMAFFDMPPMYSARYRGPHYRDFTLKVIKIVLRNHGFRYNKGIGCTFFLPKIGEFASALATYFPSWSNTTIVIATKTADSAYSPEAAATQEIY